MRTRDADLLIIPGLGGSGPDHWQSRWEAKLPSARRIEQDSWDRPLLDAWATRIAEAIGACRRPVVAIAHSLGVPALVHALARDAGPIAGAVLVAPPGEAAVRAIAEIDPSFVPYPKGRLPFPSLLVASRNDPFSTLDEAQGLARHWGANLLDAGEAKHINAESGHGPWPEGLMSFAAFMKTL